MTPAAPWPTATLLRTRRLTLEPLQIDHAEEMASVLDDPTLHAFTGGAPASATELRRRYEQLSAGFSADGSECWLNWVLRRSEGTHADAVGFVQATLTRPADELCADVAWVIGTAHQHRGFAREAANAMVDWLWRNGATSIVAYIHPEHRASAAVAERIGLIRSDAVVDGEIRWVSSTPPSRSGSGDSHWSQAGDDGVC